MHAPRVIPLRRRKRKQRGSCGLFEEEEEEWECCGCPMYCIGGMELLGLSREQGVLISWLPEGLGIELSQQKVGMQCTRLRLSLFSFPFRSLAKSGMGWGWGGGSVECGLHVEFSITLSCLVSLLRVTLSLSLPPAPHPTPCYSVFWLFRLAV